MRTNHHAVIVAAGFLATFLGLSPALADELTVTATTGKVAVIEHGRPVRLSVGAKLSPPVEIRTGADGAVDVQQLGSALHIGPNSTIALPEAASAGNAVDKIKQSAGYVLYNIKSRKSHPLSVETPYLVCVVKGTVFTIAVEEHATTVALMEGSLDISAPGVAEHVLLKPNESIRHADGEPRLSVRSSASASAIARSELRGDVSQVLPQTVQSGQMIQVARELADAGAAVAAGRTVATRQAPQLTSASGTHSGAGGSSGAVASGTAGAGNSGSGGSTNTGGSSNTSGAASTGGSAASGTANSAGTVPLPSSGSGSSTTGTSNCNGKNNGTGTGNCYGHTPGHSGKQ